jgi:hypothetical protein
MTELRLVVISGRGIRILRAVAPATVAALVAACTLEPAARVEEAVAARPASHLSLVRSAA